MGQVMWPIAVLAMEILMQNIASSCFNLGVKTETDSNIEMLCISQTAFPNRLLDKGVRFELLHLPKDLSISFNYAIIKPS